MKGLFVPAGRRGMIRSSRLEADFARPLRADEWLGEMAGIAHVTRLGALSVPR